MKADSKSNLNFPLLASGIVLFSSSLWLHSTFEKPVLEISKQDSSINFNQDFLRIMSLGNKRLIADLIWIQTLLESDLEKYSKRGLGSWMYLRFLSISELDPLFYRNYIYGGLYLSIVKDDLEGAVAIYEKGLKYYPTDYDLNYNAGFNYYYELGLPEKGLPLLEKIMNSPKAPQFLPSIINKLKRETGTDLNTIFQLVFSQYEKEIDPALKERLWSDLYSIKAEMDLSCLNSSSENCSKIDFEGLPYINQSGIYTSRRPFKSYSIRSRKNRKGAQKSPSI